MKSLEQVHKHDQILLGGVAVVSAITLLSAIFRSETPPNQPPPSPARTTSQIMPANTNQHQLTGYWAITDPNPMPAWQQERAAKTVERGHAEMLALRAQQ